MLESVWPFIVAIVDKLWTLVPGLLLGAVDFAERISPRIRSMIERHMTGAAQKKLIWGTLFVGFLIAAFLAFHDERKARMILEGEVKAQRNCAPSIEWQENRFVADENNNNPHVIGVFRVVRQSIRDYGVEFQTHGGQGQGIWAQAHMNRPEEYTRRDRPRIQLTPEGMAHFLFNPEGPVTVSVSALEPEKVTFGIKVECF